MSTRVVACLHVSGFVYAAASSRVRTGLFCVCLRVGRGIEFDSSFTQRLRAVDQYREILYLLTLWIRKIPGGDSGIVVFFPSFSQLTLFHSFLITQGVYVHSFTEDAPLLLLRKEQVDSARELT